MSKISAAIRSFLGSRLAIAVAGVFFVSFAAHAVTAPERLPPFGRIGLVELGIVSSPQLPGIELPDIIPPEIQAELKAGVSNAVTENAPVAQARVASYLATHPEAVRLVNYLGTGLSLALLLLSLRLQVSTIRRGRSDVYAFVDGGFGT